MSLKQERPNRKLRLKQQGKDKPYLTTEQKRAARRVTQLSRIYYRQYPYGLPHNGLGVKYAKYVLSYTTRNESTVKPGASRQ